MTGGPTYEEKAVRRVIEAHKYGYAMLVSDARIAEQHGYVFPRGGGLTAKGEALARKLPPKRRFDENPTTGQTVGIVAGAAVLLGGLYLALRSPPAAAKAPAKKLGPGATIGEKTVLDDKNTPCVVYPSALLAAFDENSLFVVRPTKPGEAGVDELASFGFTRSPDPNTAKVGSNSSGSIYQPKAGIYPKSSLVEAIAAAKAQRVAAAATKTPLAIVVSRGYKVTPCAPPAPAGSQKLTFVYWIVWDGQAANITTVTPGGVPQA